MPSWYRRECWRVSCDLLALEGNLYTCGRQTIFQRYDISIICPQDTSCSVCLIARGYDWLNRKCWKKSQYTAHRLAGCPRPGSFPAGWKSAQCLSLWQAEWLLWPCFCSLSHCRSGAITCWQGNTALDYSPGLHSHHIPLLFRKLPHSQTQFNKISPSQGSLVVRPALLLAPRTPFPKVQPFTI